MSAFLRVRQPLRLQLHVGSVPVAGESVQLEECDGGFTLRTSSGHLLRQETSTPPHADSLRQLYQATRVSVREALMNPLGVMAH